jgi:hypothetical protein
LPVGKTFDSFHLDAVPIVSKAQVMALTAGDSLNRSLRTCLVDGRWQVLRQEL